MQYKTMLCTIAISVVDCTSCIVCLIYGHTCWAGFDVYPAVASLRTCVLGQPLYAQFQTGLMLGNAEETHLVGTKGLPSQLCHCWIRSA